MNNYNTIPGKWLNFKDQQLFAAAEDTLTRRSLQLSSVPTEGPAQELHAVAPGFDG